MDNANSAKAVNTINAIAMRGRLRCTASASTSNKTSEKGGNSAEATIFVSNQFNMPDIVSEGLCNMG